MSISDIKFPRLQTDGEKDDEEAVMAEANEDVSNGPEVNPELPETVPEIVPETAYTKRKAGDSRRGKILGGLLAISFIAMAALVAFLVVQQHQPVERHGASQQQMFQNPQQQMCQNPECVETAGNVLRYMNIGVDPCRDFVEYSSGRWKLQNIPPPDKSYWAPVVLVKEKNNAKLKSIMDQPGYEYKGVQSSAIKKAKNYFKVCLNVSDREVDRTAKLIQLIETFGGCPVLQNSWSADNWDLTTALIESHTYKGRTALFRSSTALFKVYVSTDSKNSSRQLIAIKKSGLTLKSEKQYDSRLAEKKKKMFTAYYTGIIKHLGADPDAAQTAGEELWKFESDLAKLYSPPGQRQNLQKTTLSKLIPDFDGQIDFQRYLDTLYGEKIPESEEIKYEPDFIREASQLVKQTSKQTLANYVAWHGIKVLLNYMSSKYRQIVVEFSSKAYGGSDPPHWSHCMDEVNKAFGFATGALFVDSHFSERAKDEVTELIEAVRKTFISMLPSQTWMDEATRKKAIEKAEAMKKSVGYPEFIMHPSKLDEYYNGFQVGETDVLQNYINYCTWELQKRLKKRGKPVDKSEWPASPNKVNAMYSRSRNEIFFTAGYLQPPIYDPVHPMALKFGIIGRTVGHEITHGFDDKGRRFNAKGNLQNWWSTTSNEKFNEKAKCFIEQYSNYTFAGQHINGALTLGENIADNGGIKIAFLAYQQWLHEHSSSEPSARLPGLNLTEAQLFFVGFGQYMCEFLTPQIEELVLQMSVHAPNVIRVKGTLSNNDEFSKAFKCAADSEMNPSKKCSLW